MNKIEVCGQFFERDLEYFAFQTSFFEISKMEKLRKLKEFPNLRGASFGATNLNDEGLKYLCENKNIENLDLQETEISNEGLRALQGLRSLRTLRLKDNQQIDNDAIENLNALSALTDLQIHETSITHVGLNNLTLVNLEELLVDIWEDNYSIAFLQKLSVRLPNCTILAKGTAEFRNGTATVF